MVRVDSILKAYSSKISFQILIYFILLLFNRAVFSNDENFRIPSLHNGLNHVPAIHCNDLIRIVENIVVRPKQILIEKSIDQSDNQSELTQPSLNYFFTMASDGSKFSLHDILKKVGASAFPFCTFDEFLNLHFEKPEILLWDLDLCFESTFSSLLQYPDGLATLFKEVWGEFLKQNNLLPLSFVITGPPCSGKTTLSRALSTS